jgi:uncharacterized membrane protein YdjX (TVP38/TMEM64 family)
MTADAEQAEGRAEPSGDDAGAPSARQRHLGLLVSLVVIAIAAAGFAAIPSARHAFSIAASGNLSGLRTYIRSLGFGGAVLLFALMLAHAVVFYPSELLTTTAGYIYGFLGGLVFSLVAWTCSAMLSYVLGRTIGRPLLRVILGKRFIRLERAMERGGVELMLSARLVPVVPLSLLGYVAGATGESFWTFCWTTFVGLIPLDAAVAYLGSQAKSLSVNNPLIWVALAFLIALLILSRYLSKRMRMRPTQDDGQQAD